MTKENRFYNSSNGKLTRTGINIEKKTNVVMLNTIGALMIVNGDMTEFKKEYPSMYKIIFEDRLPSDAIPLMQHLFRALEDDPANRAIFLNSPLVKYLAMPIYRGHTDIFTQRKNENDWEKYEKNPNSHVRITGMTMYAKALKCYYTDKDPITNEYFSLREDTPIGLDFIEILSTLIKIDKDGEFVKLEKNVDRITELELLNAAKLQINNFKTKPLFAKNFIRKPKKTNEDE